VLFNLGRAVGGFAPVVFAIIARGHGFNVAIAMLAILYAVDVVVMFALPERRGMALD
jgi:hypothetical protein